MWTKNIVWIIQFWLSLGVLLGFSNHTTSTQTKYCTSCVISGPHVRGLCLYGNQSEAISELYFYVNKLAITTDQCENMAGAISHVSIMDWMDGHKTMMFASCFKPLTIAIAYICSIIIYCTFHSSPSLSFILSCSDTWKASVYLVLILKNMLVYTWFHWLQFEAVK